MPCMCPLAYTFIIAGSLDVGISKGGRDLIKCKQIVIRRADAGLLSKLPFPSNSHCKFGSKEAPQASPVSKMSTGGKINEGNGQGALLPDDQASDRAHENNSEEESNIYQTVLSDRWEFLKSLPHKLVRDIGFVIASPDLLLDSNELPTVSSYMLGGSTTKWKESKKWLKELDVQHAMDWFGARKRRTRLGDHFAACIEYVLRYSPVVQVERLLISQQVMQQTEMFSAPTVCQNGGIRSESDMSRQSERLCTSSCFTNLSVVNTSQMNVGSLEMASMKEEASDGDVVVGGSHRNQKQKSKLFKKMGKPKSCKTLTRTIGEFDFLFQCSDVNHEEHKTWSTGNSRQSIEDSLNVGDCMKAIQGAAESEFPHDADFEKEVHHWEASVKFLLYAGPWETFGMETPDYAAWKAKRIDESLEESFLCDGHKTEDCAFENSVGSTPERPPIDSNVSIPNSCKSSECVCRTNEFLGCFLGPHIGESLFDRKIRLCNQLALSQNSLAASYLYRTYIISDCSETDISSWKRRIDLSEEVVESACFSEGHYKEGNKKSVKTENQSVLKIVPGALLKGYLFYEYELWQLLRGRRENRISNSCNFCRRSIVNCTKEAQLVDTNAIDEKLPNLQTIGLPRIKYQFQSSYLKSKSTRSKINPRHWMGWWTRIHEFTRFAKCACSETSRWFIVPKQEWLSPVIVDGSDMVGCAKVMKLEEFLAVAAKVAEEAALSETPRKRRFMVAEVCWEADFTHTIVSQGQLEEADDLLLQSHGAWIEVSRGFVVEETWPDSRVYRPHGYVLNWSPSLQGWD